MKKFEIINISHDDLDGNTPTDLTKIAFKGRTVYTRNVAIRDINKVVKEVLEKINDLSIPIIITDISVNDEVAELLQERVNRGQNVYLIDHHITTVEQAKRYPWMNVTVERDGVKMSATNLYYEYLIENGYLEPTPFLDDLTELVRQYDTWDWFENNNLRAKQLNDLYYLIGREKFSEQILRKAEEQKNSRFKFTETEETILSIEQEKINRYIETKERQLVIVPYRYEENTFQIGIVYGENYHSELGNALCRNHPEMDFVVIADMGNRKFSFRSSKEEVNTSVIAKSYGGGGHPPASGCSLTAENYEVFIENILKPKIETNEVGS